MSDLQSKHEYKIKLQEVELEGKVLEEFEAVQDQLSECMDIDSD